MIKILYILFLKIFMVIGGIFPLNVSAGVNINTDKLIIEKVSSHPEITKIPNITTIEFLSPSYYASKFSFSPDVQKFPTAARTQSFIFENCTDSKQRHSVDVKVLKRFTLETTVSEAVETKQDTTTSIKYDDTNVPLKVDATLAKSLIFSLTRQESKRIEREVEETIHEDREVKPGTALIINTSVVENIARYPFTAPIVATGIIRVNYYEKLRIRNHTPIHTVVGVPREVTWYLHKQFKFEDLYPKESDRTFFAKGYIDSGLSDDVRINYSEKIIKGNKELCALKLMTSEITSKEEIPLEEGLAALDFNGNNIAVSETKLGSSTSSEEVDKIINAHVKNHSEEYDKLILTSENNPTTSQNSLFSAIESVGNNDNVNTTQIIRQYFARGQHTCQSRDSLGHKCEVRGSGYFDCNEAEFKLRNKSCCSSTPQGGSSIGFRLTKCSVITP